MEAKIDPRQGLCGLTDHTPTIFNAHAQAEGLEAMTHARREYLAEVYRLQTSTNEPITTTALAARLEVTPPAVVRMMRRLAREGYLQRQPYKGVRLTTEGEREALKSIRRHRLLEAFLVHVMKFSWDEVHEHADKLEAAINDQFEDRMDELAGYPKRCPHGDPIPSKDGVMPTLVEKSLIELEIGTQATISRIRHHTPEKLRYFAELKLFPGTQISLLGRAPFNGPVRIKNVSGEHVLGAELAEQLYMEA